MDWGIFEINEGLIGMISFDGESKLNPAIERIGYWLAKPYWNQGIMTRVLKRITTLGFKDHGFSRLEASIFSFNRASCRVAVKCGFRHVEDLPAAYQKDGSPIDAKLYVVDNEMNVLSANKCFGLSGNAQL